MRRLFAGFRMFMLGLKHPDVLGEKTFKALAKILEMSLLCVDEEKPYCTHLFIGDSRIASLWIYPGLSKNPVDRISELLKEIEELKKIATEVQDDV